MNENKHKKTGIAVKKKTNKTLTAFIVFILPIIAVFIGIFLGQYIGALIGASAVVSKIIGGIIFFALAVIVILLFDKSAIVDFNEEPITWDDM